MMTTTIKAILTTVAPPGISPKCCDKISIIGAGTVGTAIAYTLLAQKITTELVLIDEDEALARGEMLDIQHATMYLGSPHISSSKDYEAARNSKICIMTAGTRANEKDRENAVIQNTEIFKDIVPNLVSVAPTCVLIVCSCPVDIMTYVAWKLSDLPAHKVIGSGTILESARFKCLVSQRLEVQPSSCQAFVIGEQGRRSIPVWSAVSVSGVRLCEVNPQLGTSSDPEDWQEIHRQVVESAEEVSKLKECGSWGLALSVARIVKAILKDTRECIPVSTHIKGCRHGVDKDIFMSFPCIIGSSGIQALVKLNLTDSEKDMLQKSADAMHEIQKRLVLSAPVETFKCD